MIAKRTIEHYDLFFSEMLVNCGSEDVITLLKSHFIVFHDCADHIYCNTSKILLNYYLGAFDELSSLSRLVA